MKLIVFFLLLGLISCNGKLKLPSEPDNLIPKDSMVIILKELTFLETGIQRRYQTVNVYHEVMKASAKAFFEEKKISEERFTKSYDYYTSKSELSQEIHSQVIDSLNKEALLLKK